MKTISALRRHWLLATFGLFLLAGLNGVIAADQIKITEAGQSVDGHLRIVREGTAPFCVWVRYPGKSTWIKAGRNITTSTWTSPLAGKVAQFKLNPCSVDDPTCDDPACNEPGGDDPTGDYPNGDDPVIDDPAGDNPVIDNPAGDNPFPAGDIPANDDPMPTDAPKNNQAMATPDPGTSRLFWQSSDGLTVNWSLSNTGLKKSGTLCYPTSIGSNWKIEAAGDINRDGNTDVIMRRISDGAIIYWMLTQDGYKESGGIVSDAVGANWVVEASGDIDRDGTMDLVMRRQTDGMIIYWLLNQDGTKKSGGIVSDAVGANWTVQGATDIDKDGTVDLVISRTDNLPIYWLLNQDGTKKSGGMIQETPVGSNWDIQQISMN